jgi:uncharacterized membrane protein YhaH (DUF805 family)
MRRLLIAAIAFLSAGFVWSNPAHAADPAIILRIVGGIAGQPVYTAKEAPIWQSRMVEALGGLPVIVPAAAVDKRRLRDILRNTILPDWIARCGETCRGAWNDTLGAELRMPIP